MRDWLMCGRRVRYSGSVGPPPPAPTHHALGQTGKSVLTSGGIVLSRDGVTQLSQWT